MNSKQETTLTQIKAQFENGSYHTFKDGYNYISSIGYNGSTLKSLQRAGLIEKYNCPNRIWKGYWRLAR